MTGFDYIWQQRFHAALLETDTFLLREHILKARDAMSKRLGILAVYKHPSALTEYRAIQDAEAQLKVLEQIAK